MSLSSRSNTPFNSTSNNPLLNIHPTTSPFCAHQPPSTPQCYKNKNLTSRPSTPGIGKPEFSKILIPFPSYLINSFSPRTFILSRSLPTPLALPASLMKFCHDARAGGVLLGRDHLICKCTEARRHGGDDGDDTQTLACARANTLIYI